MNKFQLFMLWLCLWYLLQQQLKFLNQVFLDPSAVFLPSVATIFIVTGLLHPNEMLEFTYMDFFILLQFLVVIFFSLRMLYVIYTWLHGVQEKQLKLLRRRKQHKPGEKETSQSR